MSYSLISWKIIIFPVICYFWYTQLLPAVSTTETCAGDVQGLLPDDSASHRNITVTSLLEPCSENTFHILQQQVFQWFWLLWERPKVDVSCLSCLQVISLVCLMQAVKVVTVMQGQHVYQYVHQLLIKYLCDLLHVFIICIDSINHPPAWINCISFLGPYDSHWSSFCKWWQSLTKDLEVVQWMCVLITDFLQVAVAW